MSKQKRGTQYDFYFTFKSKDESKVAHIYWGRQTPFPDVQEEMTRQLGEGCTYAPQVGLENAEQKFD